MTQHTPGPLCACYIHIDSEPTKTRIVHCPLHAAAPEMLRFVRQFIIDAEDRCDAGPRVDDARALLAKIEGKE